PTGASAPFLVVDIGGGSTELVAGGPEVYRAVSVDVGCVRMTERHLSDPPTREQIAAAEADVAKGIGSAMEAIVGGDGSRAFPPGGATLIGLAGSVTTVAGIALGL